MRYLSALRPINLFVIAITQSIFWFYLIQPLLLNHKVSPVLSNFSFSLLLLMTILIAGAGYVINDLLDRKTDQINSPEKVFIGIKSARIYYLVLNLSAIAIAIFISSISGTFSFISVCGLCILLLWIYSRYLKSSILIGNILVSILIAAVPFIFLIVESNSLKILDGVESNAFDGGLIVSISFVCFAFLLNMVRELVKDAEDVQGDYASGVNTLATTLGLKATDRTAFAFGSLLLLGQFFWFFWILPDNSILHNFLFIMLVILPSLYLLWHLLKMERSKKKYSILSRHCKLMMGAGLVYLFIYLINYANFIN